MTVPTSPAPISASIQAAIVFTATRKPPTAKTAGLLTKTPPSFQKCDMILGKSFGFDVVFAAETVVYRWSRKGGGQTKRYLHDCHVGNQSLYSRSEHSGSRDWGQRVRAYHWEFSGHTDPYPSKNKKPSTTQTSYGELKDDFIYLGVIESDVTNFQGDTDAGNTLDGVPRFLQWKGILWQNLNYCET